MYSQIFPRDIAPVRCGVYRVIIKTINGEFEKYSYFNGVLWGEARYAPEYCDAKAPERSEIAGWFGLLKESCE